MINSELIYQISYDTVEDRHEKSIIDIKETLRSHFDLLMDDLQGKMSDLEK